jgi:hypothetical protein
MEIGQKILPVRRIGGRWQGCCETTVEGVDASD